MKLYHYKLIPVLPRQYLLNQHRQCCAIRGGNYGKLNNNTNYIFLHGWEYLYQYHQLIIKEMILRGYKPNPKWKEFSYRGKKIEKLTDCLETRAIKMFPEHTEFYLKKCINDLNRRFSRVAIDDNEAYRFYEFTKNYF